MTEIRAEAIWAVALSHPLRVRILRQMVPAYGAAPAELARRWGTDLSVVRRHFRRLRELGLIERTNRPEKLGRSAYRLCDRPATEEALWRLGAPMPARERAERLAALASAVESPRRVVLERLRARREQLGLSRTDLARRSGILPDMLGRIERGQTDPRLSVVLVLADELDYPPEQLFGGTASPQAETCR
jgi:DNA-binding XRE family transcriptional regulator/DNA-binding transcriptional ArsR family regulator